MRMMSGSIVPQARTVLWRGRSGRSYDLHPVPFADFMLETDALYLVAKGGHALWAGSAEDLIADQQSRARFRLALSCGDRAFRVSAASDDVERMTTIWDLEDAAPEQALSAA